MAKLSNSARMGLRVKRATESRLLAHIKAHPGQGMLEIARSTGMAKMTVARATTALVKTGKVERARDLGALRHYVVGTAPSKRSVVGVEQLLEALAHPLSQADLIDRLGKQGWKRSTVQDRLKRAVARGHVARTGVGDSLYARAA